MILALLIGMVLSGDPVVPKPMSKCITSCTRGVQYETEVLFCVYDELPKCARFQRICKDEGMIVCKPRVVNLGAFDHVSLYYQPAPYADLTAPSTAGPAPSSP